MGVRRDRRQAETSDSEDMTGDDSMSSDGWTTRSGDGGVSSATRTDVAVDYSIASSSHSTSSGQTAAVTKPRRHTGPRKRRVSEKVHLPELTFVAFI